MVWLEYNNQQSTGEWNFTRCVWEPCIEGKTSQISRVKKGDLVVHLIKSLDGNEFIFVGYSFAATDGKTVKGRPNGDYNEDKDFHRVDLENFHAFKELFKRGEAVRFSTFRRKNGTAFTNLNKANKRLTMEANPDQKAIFWPYENDHFIQNMSVLTAFDWIFELERKTEEYKSRHKETDQYLWYFHRNLPGAPLRYE